MKKYLFILSTLFLFTQCNTENHFDPSAIFILKQYKATRTSWMTYSSGSDGISSQEKVYSKNLPEYDGNIRSTIYKNGKYLTSFGWDLEISQIILQGDTVWVVTKIMKDAVFASVPLDLYQNADIIYKKTHEAFSIELVLRSYICQSKNNDGTFITSGVHNVGGDAYYNLDNWLKDNTRMSDTMHIHLPSDQELLWKEDCLLMEKHIIIEPEGKQLSLHERTVFENKTQAFFEENLNGPGNYAIKEVFSYPRSLDLTEKPVHESIPFYNSETYTKEFSKLMNKIRESTRSFMNDLLNDQKQLAMSDISNNRIQRVKELTRTTLKAAINGHHSGGQMGMVICAAGVNLTEHEQFSQPLHTVTACLNPINSLDNIGETTVALINLGLEDLNGITMKNWSPIFTNDSFDYEQFYKNGDAKCRANHVSSESETSDYSFETLKDDILQALNNSEISLEDAVDSFFDLELINKPEKRILRSYFETFEAVNDSKTFSLYSQNIEKIIQDATIISKNSKDFISSIMSISRHSFCYWDQVFERTLE